MPLTNDIQEAIRKNLTAEASGVLADYIKEAEEAKIQLEFYKNDLYEAQKNVKDLEDRSVGKNKTIETLQSEIVILRQNENAVQNAKIDIMKAEFERDKANAITDATLSVVDKVFRNVSVKRHVMGTENLPVTAYNYEGKPTNSGTVQQRYEKTETVEEVG